MKTRLVSLLLLSLLSCLFPAATALAGEPEQPSVIPASLVQPAYPEAEKKAGVEGTVVLACEVRADGMVADITVEQAVAGHPAFTTAATAALAQWRFEPARKDGQAVACSIKVPLKFKLGCEKR